MHFFKKDPLQIIAFQSYGTNTHFYARGRALEDENINLESKNFFSLLINSWKRFQSDEIKYTELNLKLPNNITLKAITDNAGYFLIEEPLDNLKLLTNEEGWLSFEVSYKNLHVKRIIQNENRFPGEILIPSEVAEFGIISDIDDTILQTGLVSTLKWRVLINTFFKSVKMRLPLEGATEFYQLLHLGKSGKNANPFFYVSHSPWNLYRYLELFLKQHNFPKGPILLRSFSSIFKKKTINEKPQKQKEIYNLLKTYPKLSFILIGDSGEHDADIYTEIAKEFPERIKAIYLRSVKHKRKMIRIKNLFNNYKIVPVLLVDNSKQAIKHARINGFIK